MFLIYIYIQKIYIMKILKTFEELSIDIPSEIEYEKSVQYNKIEYTFLMYGFEFKVYFKKNYFYVEDSIYKFGNYPDDSDLICDYWTRDFETSENGFDTLNISNTSSLKIFGYVNKITEDFINEYSPSILQILHISQSRYRINKLFLDKLNIKFYKFIKRENFRFPNNPITLIFKENLYEYIDKYNKQH